MIVPSASQSISVISVIISIIYSISTLISSFTTGSISGCKILSVCILNPGPTLVNSWLIWGLLSLYGHFHTTDVNLSIQSLFLSKVSIASKVTPFLGLF